jgi:hypothetical protein
MGTRAAPVEHTRDVASGTEVGRTYTALLATGGAARGAVWIWAGQRLRSINLSDNEIESLPDVTELFGHGG